jgi:polysaccharide deacetylase family protein (PEP-CTERM system associated)
MNILTIDFEDWFHLLYGGSNLKIDQWDQQFSILEENTEIILNLLRQYNTRATFFVLGWVAEKYPLLVNKIAEHGHEIANHGYSHETVNKLNYESFHNDLIKAHTAIFNACRSIPIGYRAPGFSIMSENAWALEIIKNAGYIYDSSLLLSRAKSLGLNVKNLPKLDNGLYEIAINNNNLLSINVLGGVAIRIIPKKILLNIISRNIHNNIPSIIIIHPRELNNRLPKLHLGWVNNLKTYYKLNNCIDNIKFLLEHFRWNTAVDYIQEYECKKTI